MKRINAFLIQVLLLFIMLLIVPNVGYAAAMTAAQQVQAVQSLEDTLFAVHYDQETLEARLGRIETTVFGQPQSGAPESRIGKLQSVMSPNTLGPLSPTAKTATSNSAENKTAVNSNQPAVNKTTKSFGKNAATQVPAQQQALGNNQAVNNTNAQPVQNNAAPVAGETDYPTVGQMEQKLFGKTYAQEDITVRLTRLEKQVFKTVQTGVLADRVDNLRLVVLGDTGIQPTAAMAYNDPAQAPSPGSYAPLPGAGYSQFPTSAGASGYPQYPSGGYPQAPNYAGAGYTGTPIASTQPYYGSQAGYPPMGGVGGGDPLASTNYNPAPGGNYYPSSPTAQGGEPTPDMLAAMTEVEKEVLGKTYPSEPIASRLDRVETKVFHATSPELSADERMQRVIAVASAGGAPQTGKAKAKSTFQSILPIILTILPMVLL